MSALPTLRKRSIELKPSIPSARWATHWVKGMKIKIGCWRARLPASNQFFQGRFLFVLAILLGLQGCSFLDDWRAATPSPQVEAEPTLTSPPLPDLVLASIGLETEDGDVCYGLYRPLGIRVRITNEGLIPAGPFVVELNGAGQNVPDGLDPDEMVNLWFPDNTGSASLRIDANSTVGEGNEANNWFERKLEKPELPTGCRPTATPALETSRPLLTLEGHTAKVWSVAFRPDGLLLASGSVDNTLRFWSIPSGRLTRTLPDHPFPILSLAFSPNGNLLATGSTDGIIRLWRVADSTLQRQLKGHAGWIPALAYSPDGRFLASTAEDFTVRLWRTVDGKLMNTIDEGMSAISSLTYSPDGKTLAWAETDRIRFWSTEEEKWGLTLQVPGEEPKSLAFSPDGQFLISGYANGTFRLWNCTTGKSVLSIQAHDQAISGVAYSPDGAFIVSASTDSSLRLWQVTKAGYSLVPIRTLIGAQGPITSVAFSPDGAFIASGSEDHTVRLWQTQP